MPTSPDLSSTTKDDLRSNPHPYAIRTTSTGILTRSNSTHSTSSASHHFVPSSPSKPKVNQSRPNGHRYSRSLTTTELPRPLPVPPKADLDPQDAQTVPHHGAPRFDTLPSLSQPNLLPEATIADELPDDPRVWTPSQLSAYLSSSLRVTSGDLPQIIAQDIATFALTQKITGHKFVRLTERDLDKYGLNQRWQNALLGASRNLRKNSLRGRMRDFRFLPDDQNAEQEDLDESYSSTSSISSSDSFQRLHRGRPQSTHGRVKGMVASFERSGPSRSVSPGKDPSYSETNTPAIRTRPRPHSDTFPSRFPYVMSPASEDSTSSNLPKETDQKEPRLLPYPPSPPQVLPEFTSFNMSPPPTHIQGVPTFGPYGSPVPPPREPSFPVFPHGALPFSPQSTATSILPPGNTIAPQPQAVDSPYISVTTEGVRPLPLPPHSGQFYQPLVSASAPQVHGGIMVIDDSRNGANGLSLSLSSFVSRSESAPPPHAALTESSTLAQVPHVQIQHVPPESTYIHTHIQAQAPAIVDTQLLPPYHPHKHQNIHSPQQSDSLHLLQQPSQVTQILAPQPRLGGRESPTKLLEEKLEELLEPRPRSRVFPGQPSSHSRVPSTSKEKPHSPGPSRPRSRVPSMNLAGTGGGSINGKSKLNLDQVANEGAAMSEDKSIGNISMEGSNSIHNRSSLGVNGPAGVGPLHHPRTRVLSLSSRPHTHRLSGVEAWGENHRHIVVPPGEAKLTTTEEGVVKELEGEEDVGIEALLEKVPPSLPLPLLVPTATSEGGDSTIFGHAKESSSGSVGSAGSITHSRSGSLREPKSVVITLVERKPSSKLHMEDTLEGMIEEGTQEDSMEALLAKADSSLGSGTKWRSQGGNTKKRMPLTGAEAWETAAVDTVKHIEGDGMSRSIENIFSPVPSSSSATITTPTPYVPRPKQNSPSPHSGKAKLKPKTRKSLDGGDIEIKARLDELERKEQQLEKNVDETRKIVEEMKGRLEIVERWIVEKGRTTEEKDTGKRRRSMWMVLSASRVPGMLGLSAWFGAPSSSTSSTSPSNAQAARDKTQSRTSLIYRIAKMGLSLGTCTVLFGIGICVVLLRALGRWPAVIARLGNVGTRIRNGMRR